MLLDGLETTDFSAYHTPYPIYRHLIMGGTSGAVLTERYDERQVSRRYLAPAPPQSSLDTIYQEVAMPVGAA